MKRKKVCKFLGEDSGCLKHRNGSCVHPLREQRRDAPGFLIRLVGRERAKCLFNQGMMRHRHD